MDIVFPGGKKVDVRYKDFVIHTDQSEASGGEGSAPEPFGLFLASLGACAGIYVLSFCQNRQISTEGLRLVQRTLPGPEGKGLGRVEIEVILPPDFPEKYVSAVVRAADLCAVKKAILNPPEMVVSATRG
jgi:ribosomal protein S12 methylthiotransferase accessory factor